MGQVPECYGLVGDGRLAKHIARYFDLLKIPLISWSRKSQSSAVSTLKSCDVIMLAISDGAIAGFVSENSNIKKAKLIHFSGSLSTPVAQSFLPLMTFTAGDLYDLETYENIAFVSEKG